MQNCYPKKSSRDMTADQTERLTTKHIQTLGFLQEIVNENKQLKARVEELEVRVILIVTPFPLFLKYL